ncbi:hypothetical protein BJ742DRAFT_855198 [Cladochytrium replicatum]|nr:hypothetical protein BJ742DRAFT_855198 [Cladochytrium replicatum]
MGSITAPRLLLRKPYLRITSRRFSSEQHHPSLEFGAPPSRSYGLLIANFLLFASLPVVSGHYLQTYLAFEEFRMEEEERQQSLRNEIEAVKEQVAAVLKDKNHSQQSRRSPWGIW